MSFETVQNLRRPLLKGGVVLFLLLAIASYLNNLRKDLPSTTSSATQGPQVPEPKLLYDDLQTPQPGIEAEWSTSLDRYDMSASECSSKFSHLFPEIERAVEYRKGTRKVEPHDIDIGWKAEGAVRAMIYKQKLFILESNINDEYMISRALGTLHQIDRALTSSPERLPDIEFSFVVSDLPDPQHAHHTFWSLSRLVVDEETWLMPDFGYWSWPLDLVGNYEQIRAELSAKEPPWEQKITKALWRGAVKTNPVRSHLLQMTRDKEWADVQEVRWRNRTHVASGETSNALSMVDHCNYQFLIHTEGRSYSGRGKYLLNCESVTIMHKREWIEPHHSVLIATGPHQNFVEVERDFSDLESKVKDLLNDPERAKAIARNSATTFRDQYLSPASQACYWRHLIKAWAKVSFAPKPWVMISGKKQLRGVPFETFV
ncbi:hypothetical protein DM02DRAFT_709342 [Periconia macrospinosa]|uniref:Glycosyl transferase CAP10 domain-containing protein n=1 Tax=Periconia macrospinosa TaxID=97972 RepID=A0A2V1E958_9PLEO|nr:hypothetical protein DM02DRAFT_709342 [Periconia macrospinosa]